MDKPHLNECFSAQVPFQYLSTGMIFLFSFCGSRYSVTKACCVAFVLTFFSMFDVPVFWPILLCYWIFLFVLTMRRQIMHMIKYKYLPFNIGKQKYSGKKSAASRSGSHGD